MSQSLRRNRNLADFSYPSTDMTTLVAKALEVTTLLTEQFGEAPFSKKDPMSMLVDILLSHRTRDEQTAAGYANLLKRFGSWEGVRDAPTKEVEETIANVSFPEVKAPRIQAIMRQITEERGSLNLDFLCSLPTEDAVAWLNRFSGIGPKTIGCVLLFSCKMPLLPVDVHVHRTSIRIGLIGKKVTADNAHALLQALLPDDARTIYNFHKGLLRLGQRICVYDHPRCSQCKLTALCDYYKTVVNPG
ncbi:endonuclease III domain-containing protein [Tengunoibacter tsumagoiensis]|uniref:Endonuclease III n=1 Tax=Tengunoibacter tsumagoiensis TaxID=2014871 RepID=A0A402A764_9CHLR|nr:endonuclease III [Tengunoibacter tsumagoiensis]GCE14938.1 endonuclease III [Tengunoibacter tsumagoiensis]